MKLVSLYTHVYCLRRFVAFVFLSAVAAVADTAVACLAAAAAAACAPAGFHAAHCGAAATIAVGAAAAAAAVRSSIYVDGGACRPYQGPASLFCSLCAKRYRIASHLSTVLPVAVV